MTQHHKLQTRERRAEICEHTSNQCKGKFSHIVAILSLLFLTTAFPALAQQQPPPLLTPLAAPQRTYSSSQQFVVYATDSKIRLDVARRADDITNAWQSSTGNRDQWKWPIIVQFFPREETRLTQPTVSLFVGDGYTAKIQVNVPASINDPKQLDYYLASAIALEVIYRAGPPQVGKPYTLPPPWLATAVAATARPPQSSAIFSQLLDGVPPPHIGAFLRQHPATMDPTSLEIYRARSTALLLSLQATYESYKGLAGYLLRLRDERPDDPRILLSAFPSLSTDASMLPKLWTLSLARNSVPRDLETFSATDTRRQLAKILAEINVATDNTAADTAALQTLAKDPGGRIRISNATTALRRLEVSAHPLYRPIVAEYHNVLAKIVNPNPSLIGGKTSQKKLDDIAKRGPTKKDTNRLGVARDLNRSLDNHIENISDYVNWFEVTKQGSPNRDRPMNTAPAAPARNDAISRALDAAESRH